jgi:hypothetical protein
MAIVFKENIAGTFEKRGGNGKKEKKEKKQQSSPLPFQTPLQLNWEM